MVATVKSWKQAFSQLSLPTDGVTLEKSEEYFTVKGLPNGWEAAWVPNNPDTGSHVLFIYPRAQQGIHASMRPTAASFSVTSAIPESGA